MTHTDQGAVIPHVYDRGERAGRAPARCGQDRPDLRGPACVTTGHEALPYRWRRSLPSTVPRAGVEGHDRCPAQLSTEPSPTRCAPTTPGGDRALVSSFGSSRRVAISENE